MPRSLFGCEFATSRTFHCGKKCTSFYKHESNVVVDTGLGFLVTPPIRYFGRCDEHPFMPGISGIPGSDGYSPSTEEEYLVYKIMEA